MDLSKYKKVPVRFFLADKGKPGFEHLEVSATPNVVPGWQEIPFTQVQQILREKNLPIVTNLGKSDEIREMILKGQIPKSTYYESIPGLGTFVPEKKALEYFEMRKKEEGGEMKNIGTPEKPLWIPTGSPADRLRPWEKQTPQPTPQPTAQPTQLGEPLPFPKTQAEMEEYKKNYYWDPETKKWYKSSPALGTISKGVEEISKQVPEIGEEVAKLLASTGKGKLYQSSESIKGEEKTKEIEEQQKSMEEITKNQQEIERLTTEKALRDLRAELGLNPETGEPLEKPTVPTYESDFEALRSEYGLAALESQINNIEQQIREVQDSLLLGVQKEEGRLAPMELIGARQKELMRQAEEVLNTLDRRKKTLLDEYNTKLNIVNQLMTFKQLDYQTAQQAYSTEFNQRIQLLNILDKRQTREEQEANRERDDARANLTILQNIIQDSGVNWDEVDPTLKTEIRKLELKAGLPAGVTQAFLKTKPDNKILYTSTGTDINGNDIVTFIYEDPDNPGMPGVVRTVTTGGVSEETAQTSMGVLVQLPTGEKVDITTPEGARAARESGASYSEVKSLLDEHTNWTSSTIESFLEESGFVSPEKSKAKQEDLNILKQRIEEYKKEWAKGGDKRAGTREEFAADQAEVRKNLTYEEILEEVYKQVPDSWLEANKPKSWWKRVFK